MVILELRRIELSSLVETHPNRGHVVHKTVRAQQVVEQHKVESSKIGLNECPFQRLEKVIEKTRREQEEDRTGT